MAARSRLRRYVGVPCGLMGSLAPPGMGVSLASVAGSGLAAPFWPGHVPRAGGGGCSPEQYVFLR